MYTIIAYTIYLVCSIITVFVVGKILHRNGEHYLFGECADKALSHSANNFLYTGYCVINTGFALFYLGSSKGFSSLTQVIEFVTSSQGTIFLSLGALHFVNVLLAPGIINYFLKRKHAYVQK